MNDSLQLTVDHYVVTRSAEARDKVVRAALPLVRSILGKLSVPRHPLASREDLESMAVLGLLQALDSYAPERNVRFVTHAYNRVRGALIDYLRSIDVLSRQKRQRLYDVQRALDDLHQLVGGEPSDHDVAHYLGIDIEEYHDLLVHAQNRFTLSIDTPPGTDERSLMDVVADNDSQRGFDDVERDSELAVLERVIPTLPEREQTILGLYYIENLTLREIGLVIGVTDARVAQIMGKILLKLQRVLTSDTSRVAA
jgi:RNA polymerase sigma factor FliA